MLPNEGSLVFKIPGWDVLDEAKRAGFSDAGFIYIASREYGIVSSDHLGVLIFFAKA